VKHTDKQTDKRQLRHSFLAEVKSTKTTQNLITPRRY